MNLGLAVAEGVISVAGLLKNPAAPGWVTLGLFATLVLAASWFFRRTQMQMNAVSWLYQRIRAATDGSSFATQITDIDVAVAAHGRGPMRRHVAEVWQEYRETLVEHSADGQTVLRNSARPSSFFNVDDLGYGAGFARYAPGLFVTAGLFLTFLGLISALSAMNLTLGNSTDALNDLLKIASAKFIMSLTGLLCSILFTVLLRWRMGALERRLHDLCHALEQRLSFVSLESLAIDQLKATQEQREHLRALAFELVAELGRPLREELPAAISNSISTAMSPLLDKIGQVGADGMGSMVEDLSKQFSGDVSKALSDASGRLAVAGMQIGRLADRMDQSSGRMGAEMEQAVSRVAQAVDDLRGSMSSTAATATGALKQGTEELLTVMNTTLESIRDNTGEGARAMSAAAGEMRQAAEGFRAEIEGASRSGAEAARQHLQKAGVEAGTAIGDVARETSDAFGRTSAEIVEMANQLSARAAQELIAPVDAIAGRLREMLSEIGAGVVEMRRMSDAVRSGAEAGGEAAGAFRGASQAFVAASQPLRETSERIEASVRSLAQSTEAVAGVVSQSAERTALTAAATLDSASQVLGAEHRAINAALDGLTRMLEAQRGQGDRLDSMDEKLGRAFEAYRTNVDAAVQGMVGHVRLMSAEMNRALDTMHGILESLEPYHPQSRRA
jgi:methyl-accepting chemotaxis protein